MKANALGAVVLTMAGVTTLAAVNMLACVGSSGGPGACPSENAEQSLNVAGTYRYSGDTIFLLRGTITFAQEGELVRVTGTTYDNSGDRDLISDPTPLRGNRLDIVLTPKNGDPDYRAEVTFMFTDDGDEFCVAFSDTNGDAGTLGTYRGVRIGS